MPYEQRDDSGSLFRNDRKERDNQPDYKGDARINGEDYWISAWIKEGKNGKFMSLAFSLKEKKPPAAPDPDFNEDLPF